MSRVNIEKCVSVRIHTKRWERWSTPPVEHWTCMIIACDAPSEDPDAIAVGQQVAWGEGDTELAAKKNALDILQTAARLAAAEFVPLLPKYCPNCEEVVDGIYDHENDIDYMDVREVGLPQWSCIAKKVT